MQLLGPVALLTGQLYLFLCPNFIRKHFKSYDSLFSTNTILATFWKEKGIENNFKTFLDGIFQLLFHYYIILYQDFIWNNSSDNLKSVIWFTFYIADRHVSLWSECLNGCRYLEVYINAWIFLKICYKNLKFHKIFSCLFI